MNRFPYMVGFHMEIRLSAVVRFEDMRCASVYNHFSKLSLLKWSKSLKIIHFFATVANFFVAV